MKANKIIYSAIILATAGAMTSCSDSYLDLAPQTSISNNDMVSTVDGAQLAMVGICQAMWQQYQSIQGNSTSGYNCFNGEAYINHRLIDAFGPDAHVGIGLDQWGEEFITGGAIWQSDLYPLNVIPWKYCYNLIQQANKILDGIDNAEGDATKREFIKAQVLTLRAHGYTKLMQFFAPRWEDSNNGDVICAVMRDTGTVEGAPLCTMNDVFELIYNDLDTAIELYKSSGLTRDKKWMPDLNVAYGIYARAAMIIHDFEKAQTMAHNASQGYVVMDNDTYLSGFFQDNNDFMWTSSSDENDTYYWSEFAFFATNGAYTYAWQEADAIDMDLYRQLDPNDIRRKCFFTPDKIKVVENENPDYNPANLTETAFWVDTLINETKNLNIADGAFKENPKDPSQPWGLYNVALYYSIYYGENIFTGDFSSMGNPNTEERNVQYDYYALYSNATSGKVRLTKDTSASLAFMNFGAQFKFWATPPYSSGYYPFMRATEMKLLEAEAAYYNGDETTCSQILNEINGIRIPGYSFSGSGQALLDELRLCRRIELWDEGHSWTDYKRWNLPITRRAWVADDPTSGNWAPTYAKETPVNTNSGWRVRVPRSELDNNTEIDQAARDALNAGYK